MAPRSGYRSLVAGADASRLDGAQYKHCQSPTRTFYTH